MKRLRVKSNYARNKTLVLGPNNNLVLHFDRHGVAAFAAHLLPVLQAEMQMRPGRFRVLKDEPKAPESTSQLKEIEEVLEVLKREEEEEELELEIADVEDEDEPESDDEEEDDSTGEDE